MDGRDGMRPSAGTGGGAMGGPAFHVQNPSPNSVVFSAPQAVKKKRGRPRKYGSHDGGMSLGLFPLSSSTHSSASLIEKEKARRGRPLGTGWKQKLAPLGGNDIETHKPLHEHQISKLDKKSPVDETGDKAGPLKSILTDLEVENTIDAIKARHGDIDKDCIFRSEWVRKHNLICICKVLKELQKKRLEELDIASLEHYSEAVRDIGKLHVNVKWLLERLDKIKDAIVSRDKTKVLTDEKVECMKEVEEKRREVERLNKEVQILEGQVSSKVWFIEELNKKISNRTSKLYEEFQNKPLMDGLI